MSYESAIDTDAEDAAFRQLEAEFGVVITRFPKYAAIDALATKDGVPRALIEFKRRNIPYEKMKEYGSVFVDLDKMETGQLFAAKQMIKFYFVVKLTDALLYFYIPASMALRDLKTEVVKLNEPRDVNDEDLVVHFPIQDFRVIHHEPQTVSAG